MSNVVSPASNPIGPLVEADESFCHQVIDSFACVGSSDLSWTDSGEEAVRMGLADGLANLDYVAREIVKADNIVDYTPQEDVASRLAKRFGASIGAGAVQTLRNLSPVR